MCWRTFFLRRMKSQTKGTHYNICACARKKTAESWKKIRRYGRALYDTRVLTCSTPGSRHVRHPGLGTFDTRVSDTRKRLTELMAQEGDDTETCNEKKDRKKKWILCLKSISIHCFCAADQSSIFLNSTFHLFTLIIYLLPTLYPSTALHFQFPWILFAQWSWASH